MRAALHRGLVGLPGIALGLLVLYLMMPPLLRWLGGWLAADGFFAYRANLPSSGHEVGLFMALAVAGVWCWLTFDEGRWRRSLEPAEDFLRWQHPVRLVVLVTLPLLAGVWALVGQATGSSSGDFQPIRHPTPPDLFSHQVNPFRAPTGAMLEAFDEGLASGAIAGAESSEEAVREYAAALGSGGTATEAQRKLAYHRSVVEEGRVLFMINCRPCHGTKVLGDGPMAPGQLREPADFTGVETIATLVEGAVFWRVKQGGVRLPREGAPWESAMPRWEEELSDEQIWKIITAEYDLAGNRPREPEAVH